MTSSTFASDVDFDRDDVAYPYVLEHGQMRKASTEFVRSVICCVNPFVDSSFSQDLLEYENSFVDSFFFLDLLECESSFVDSSFSQDLLEYENSFVDSFFFLDLLECESSFVDSSLSQDLLDHSEIIETQRTRVIPYISRVNIVLCICVCI